MPKPLVKRHDSDGVATLTLNRPEVLNAISADSFRELRAHVDDIVARPDEVGCVVLCGAGRSFCAGADLKAFKNRKPTDSDPTTFNRATMTALASLPQPVIAAVHGHCMTGGLELALTSDIIIAADNTRFADTHQKLGLHAGWGLTQRLPRRIGSAMAKEMMFSGREVLTDEALRIGLVNRVVPLDRLQDEVQALAALIASHPRGVARWVKTVIDKGSEMTLGDGLALEIETNPGRNPDLEARLSKGGF
ncbi:enoyl-CoA hydratase/carnithine racemase [Sphingobium xenophagum]|uniref:Enoyl-CoA hydratase/carnithine racemase n=1 Tax=Sphingobium xenophagum TaxID=121428 RepID=A0ABU1X6S4_SPHXE|nr:enoyl-CoA hydratase/isomerase family protein [Sphingobium xenophagum]MDR7157270.1 enoyl-CoA hydratase/carnithine racemase [Sphingobium xenophagum]